MPDFIDVPITVDTESLQNDAVAYIQDKVDGYTLNPAHPMTWLIEAIGRNAAEVAAIVAQMPAAAFRYLGSTVYGIPPNNGTPAIAVVTFTASDTDGHTIPAGTQITIDDRAFATDDVATIDPGSSSVTDVAVTALLDGTDGNGLGADAEPVDAFPWLDSITVVGTTAGGTDIESDDDYQTRLAQELSLQAPRPITLSDFAKFAKKIDGVDRAYAYDGRTSEYNLLTANQASVETDLSGWTVTNLGTGTATRDNAQALDGTWSVKFDIVSGAINSNNAKIESDYIAVDAGYTYYAVWSYRIQSGLATTGLHSLQATWYDASNNQLGITTGLGGISSSPLDTWISTVSTSFTAPAGAAKVKLAHIINPNTSGSTRVWLDRFGLRRSDAAGASDNIWYPGGTSPLLGRSVRVAAIDSAGEAISAPLKAQLDALLQADREVNFDVQVVDPTYTTVNVTYSVQSVPNVDKVALKATIDAAITDYLSPANWGQPDYVGDERVWVLSRIVRTNELVQLVSNIDGVDYVISMSPSVTTLSGDAPLTRPGTMTGTVF